MYLSIFESVKEEKKEFASVSHAVQKALLLMREKYELEEKP